MRHGDIESTTSIFMDEQAAALGDVAGKGQFWVKDDVPNVPMFTDDAGTDAQLGTVLALEYTSTGQTITSAALLTLAHSLGVAPKIIEFYLKCTTAEDNYSIGDEIKVSLEATGVTATSRTNGIYFDATNVYVRFTDVANCFRTADKTTGGSALLTNSSWQLYVRAFA